MSRPLSPFVSMCAVDFVREILVQADRRRAFKRVSPNRLARWLLRPEVSRGAISNGLKTAGVERALVPKHGMTLREFLKGHWSPSALALVRILFDDGEFQILGIFTDHVHLVARRVLLMLRGHAHINRRAFLPFTKAILKAALQRILCEGSYHFLFSGMRTVSFCGYAVTLTSVGRHGVAAPNCAFTMA